MGHNIKRLDWFDNNNILPKGPKCCISWGYQFLGVVCILSFLVALGSCPFSSDGQ